MINLLAVGIIMGSAQGDKLAPYTETLPNSPVKVKMLPVPAGKVKIGDKEVEVKPFYMAETETVWEAYDLFLASGPPSPAYDTTDFKPDAVARPSKSYILPDLNWGHAGYPAINISSLSADMFCRWLAKQTGKKYRLPTEAEWELAAGPGELSKEQADKMAVYGAKKTGAVAKKEANKLGLYDMQGNVGEWTTNLKGEPILCGGAYMDPVTNLKSSMRREWEPAWQESDPQFPKSRWWLSNGPFCGFRIVCEP